MSEPPAEHEILERLGDTPMLCERCMTLHPAHLELCPDCEDEPLMDLREADTRQMLREFDQRRVARSSRRAMMISTGITAAVMLALGLGLMAIAEAQPGSSRGLGDALFQLWFYMGVFVGLPMVFGGEVLLMRRFPPRRASTLWGEAPERPRLTIARLFGGS